MYKICRCKCTQGDCVDVRVSSLLSVSTWTFPNLHEKLWEYCCSMSVVSAGVHACAALVNEYIWEEPLEILGPLRSNCGQSDPNLIFVLFLLTLISVCHLYLT